MKVNRKPNLHKSWIDPHALGIVRALQKAGFTTYLVGGCVRDLLLGILPKDFDIATSAKPDEVRKVIFRSFVIGKRFRLVLVKRDDQQFEVATFRRDLGENESSEDAPFGDNIFGTPEEDARRRDFTINSLFFDPVADKLIDHAHGLPDLESRFVRMIGDPDVRLVEDPIRILRALRLAHMIDFTLDDSLRAAMKRHAGTLPATALPRRREEFLKLMRLSNPGLAFLEAYDLDILKSISPHLHIILDSETSRDVFLSHLIHVHDFAVNKQNPLELFALLVLAYVRARLQVDVTVPWKSSEWEEHPELLPLMRDELGMFKFEQAAVAKALHLQSVLQKKNDFAQRGFRRQLAVLRNESFPLALTLAQRDYVLRAPDLLYWMQAYTKAEPQLRSLPNESRRRRRRRRRKVVESEMTAAGITPHPEDA